MQKLTNKQMRKIEACIRNINAGGRSFDMWAEQIVQRLNKTPMPLNQRMGVAHDMTLAFTRLVYAFRDDHGDPLLIDACINTLNNYAALAHISEHGHNIHFTEVLQ